MNVSDRLKVGDVVRLNEKYRGDDTRQTVAVMRQDLKVMRIEADRAYVATSDPKQGNVWIEILSAQEHQQGMEAAAQPPPINPNQPPESE